MWPHITAMDCQILSRNNQVRMRQRLNIYVTKLGFRRARSCNGTCVWKRALTDAATAQMTMRTEAKRPRHPAARYVGREGPCGTARLRCSTASRGLRVCRRRGSECSTPKTRRLVCGRRAGKGSTRAQQGALRLRPSSPPPIKRPWRPAGRCRS